MANPGTAAVVSPQQPQTTVEPPGGPFVRHSEPGKRRIYDLTSQAFGGLINQPLKAVPGYVSKFRFEVIASGGVNGNSTVVAAASDAPESCVSLITVRDALGTPIVSGPGFEILRLVPMYSGGFGLGAMFDTHNLPSFSAVTTGSISSTGLGAFTFSTAIPFEFGKAYGVIGMADASELPDVSIQLAASSAVYTTAPPTVPTMEWKLGADFYWLPQGEDIEPPGLGSTRQWFLKQGNPSIPSASTETILLPRQGGWLDTLIFELRDANNVRIDGWPTIIRIYIDGIGIIDSTLDEFKDDMQIVWGYGGSFTRPTGTLAWCRKTSLNQVNLGYLDTYEVAQSTSPGTSIEFEGAPWGTITSGPAVLNVVEGLVIPSGSLLMGLEEL